MAIRFVFPWRPFYGVTGTNLVNVKFTLSRLIGSMIMPLLRSLLVIACSAAAMVLIVSILAMEHVERSLALTVAILIVGGAASLWNKAHRAAGAPHRPAQTR